MFNRTGYEIFHIILGIVIVLNIIDFFNLLSPFFDFTKKIISWTLIAIIFYNLKPSKIIFGQENKIWDIGFIIAGLLLVADVLVRYAKIMRETMLNNIGLYYEWFLAQGEGFVVSVNDTVFAQMEFSAGVGVVDTMREFASTRTLFEPSILVTFQNSVGEQLTYLLGSYGFDGSLLPFFNLVVLHANSIQVWGLIIAMSLVLSLGVYTTLRLPIGQKSIVGLIDYGEAHGLARILMRLILVVMVSLAFLLFIFVPVVEWLALALDAPILVLALLVSVLLILLHKKSFSFEQWEEWVTDFGSNIKPYIELFCNKKTVLLGVSGILVLHLLVEIFTYIIPLLLPVTNQLYLTQLPYDFVHLFSLVDSLWWYPLVLLNVFAWVCILAIPGYIWYKIYLFKTGRHGHPSFSPLFLGVFFGSLVVALLNQMIWFSRIDAEGLIGVYFFGQAPTGDPVVSLMLFVGVFALTYFFAQFSVKRFLYIVPVFLPLVFMGVYTWLFFESAFTYYLDVSLTAFMSSWYFLGFVLMLFLLLSSLFYISAFMFFVYEVIKEEH